MKTKRLKRCIVAISLVAVIVFLSIAFLIKNMPSKIYSLLYPQSEISVEFYAEKKVLFKKGDYIILGRYYDEPILWKYVFDEDGEIFQSVKILDFMKYDDNCSDWNTSYLNNYLNTTSNFEFLSTNNDNAIELFVLSKNQLSKIDAKDRVKSPTISAINRSGSQYLFLRKNYWYWTSSGIATNNNSVATVTQVGGFYKTPASDNLTGVCPAFKMDTDFVTVCGGNGTENSPYIIAGDEYDEKN